MKRAIIILYNGSEITPSAQNAIGNILHEYGLIDNPDSPVDFYSMTEGEIVQAIVSKVVAVIDNNSQSDKYEHAISIVCEPFMKRIKDGDLDAFTIELTNTLRDCINDSNERSTKFRDAVKIIAEDGSEAHLSSSFMFNHGLSNRIIQIIRRTRDVVCQGRHIIIQ